MPLSRDSSLWWNMAGCVAAYQPARAPGPLDARYNMANGGSNRYRAEPGIAPSFNPATGWGFVNGSSTYLKTGIIAGDGWSAVVRYSGATANQDRYLFGAHTSTPNTYYTVIPSFSNKVYYGCGGALTSIAPQLLSGVVGITPSAGYRNGVFDVALAGGTYPSIALYIGALNLADPPFIYGYVTANIQAITFYARPLSAAEVYTISRQLAYCDANPDWNVWAPRRQWFLYSGAAASKAPHWMHYQRQRQA